MSCPLAGSPCTAWETAQATRFFYTFFFGPRLRMPFSSRAFSIWATFQSLTAFPFTSLTRGAAILRLAIQDCNVARGMSVILAT